MDAICLAIDDISMNALAEALAMGEALAAIERLDSILKVALKAMPELLAEWREAVGV